MLYIYTYIHTYIYIYIYCEDNTNEIRIDTMSNK